MKNLFIHNSNFNLLFTRIILCILFGLNSVVVFSQVNLTDGLIAFIPFDGSGKDLSDSSNNVSNVSGSTSIYAGIDHFMNPYKSMRFVGDRGKAEMSFGRPLMNDRTSYSVSLWVMMTASPISSSKMNIFGQDNLLEFHYETISPTKFIVYHPTGGSMAINLSPSFYNTWRHIVITGNSTEFNVYMNGAKVITKSGNYSIGHNTYPTNIGGEVIDHSTTGNSWMVGNIDELRIYNRVITADEIAALYNDNLPSLAITSINNNIFCAGSPVTVNYSANGYLQTANTYYLQLSQPDGTFNYPIILDSIKSNALTGSFNSTIPLGALSGTAYKLRVTSSNISAGVSSSAITINGVLGNIPSSSSYFYVGGIDEKHYYMSKNASVGGTANTTANSNGGRLATIYDASTNQLLWYNAKNANPYIGLNDIDKEGVYVWRDGSPLSYTNWDANQPDDGGSSEDYAEIRYWNGTWNDLNSPTTAPHYLELTPAGNNRYFCLGNDLSLNAKTLTGATYAWTGPHGFSSNDQNTTITNAQSVNAGTYTLTYSLNGCSAAVNINIDMNPLPAGSTIALQKDSICAHSSTTILINNSDTAISYQLRDTLDNNIGSAQIGNKGDLIFNTGNIDTTKYLKFYYQFTKTGCNSESPRIIVHTRRLPLPPITTGAEVCNGGSMTLLATGDGTYNWYTTAAGGSPLIGKTSSTLIIDTNITQTYYVSITDKYGCEGLRSSVIALVKNPLNPIDIKGNLIVHYKFNGDIKDYSGNHYDATQTGTFNYRDDHNGAVNAAITTGTNKNNYMSAGNPSKVNQLSNQVTLSMWINQRYTWFGNDGTLGEMALVNKWNGSTGLLVMLRMLNPSGSFTNRVRFRVNGNNYVESQVNVPIGEWHHIVCTYNGAKLSVYQDGVLSGTANCTGNIGNTGNSLMLGVPANGMPSGQIPYNGSWDEVKIYGRAFSADEVKVLHNNESVAFANTPFCDKAGDLILTTFNFPGATYEWTGPNGFTSANQNPTPIINADSLTYSGAYHLKVTANGCTSDIQDVQAIIHLFPDAPTTTNDTVCGSGDAILRAKGNTSGLSYLWYNASSGGSAISGQTADSLKLINVLATTSRYVSVTRYGCESPRSDVSAIYINPVATNLTVTGSSSCKGDSAFVEVMATEANVLYQAFLNSSPISKQYHGGGNIKMKVATSSMVEGKNSVSVYANYVSCGPVVMTDTATVHVNPLPIATITPSGTVHICSGDIITISASSGSKYEWNNGASTSSININAEDTFSVKLTDANGCSKYSPETIVKIDVLTTPTLTSSKTEICEGSSILLNTNSISGVTYKWMRDGSVIPGATGSNYNAMQAGVYKVQLSNACVKVSNSLTLSTIAKPITSSISGNNPVLCSSTSELYSVINTTGSSYQWTIPSGALIINGQGSNSIKVNFKGNYGLLQVIETNNKDCQGNPGTVMITCDNVTNINNNIVGNIRVFPNPTSDIVQIHFDNAMFANLTLYSTDGNEVLNNVVYSMDKVDVSKLLQGIYIGSLTLGNNQPIHFILIKQ